MRRILILLVTVDYAININHNEIFYTKSAKKRSDCNSSSTCAVDYNGEVGELFLSAFCSIYKRRADNDCRSVLVVVENRDIKSFLELFFDFKASRSRNILKVYSAKAIAYKLDCTNDFVCVLALYANRKCVNACKLLKKTALSIPARPPMSPRPRTAVPSVITATRFFLLVSS